MLLHTQENIICTLLTPVTPSEYNYPGFMRSLSLAFSHTPYLQKEGGNST